MVGRITAQKRVYYLAKCNNWAYFYISGLLQEWSSTNNNIYYISSRILSTNVGTILWIVAVKKEKINWNEIKERLERNPG